VEVVEGMQFDRGFLSPHFVTNQDQVTVELDDCYLLIFEEKISSNKKLIPILEAISRAKKPLLVIAEDVEGEALATLVVNKMRGILQVCASRPGLRRPPQGHDGRHRRPHRFHSIFKDLGIDLESVKLSDLGRAKKVKVTSDETIIIGGAGKKAEMRAGPSRFARRWKTPTATTTGEAAGAAGETRRRRRSD